MAEALGVVASVAQLVALSGQLLAGGYGFLSRVSRAPSEIRSLLIEIAALNGLLGRLQALTDSTPNRPPDDALLALERLGAFKECQTILKSIQKALSTCAQIHGKDVSNFGRRLIWPFKEKETKDSLQRLHHLRGLLANAVEADSASALRRIETRQGQMVDGLALLTEKAKTEISQDEANSILSWICPVHSGEQVSLQNALSLRSPGTGMWFLQSETFENWMGSKTRTVWISGLPGSGKTLLSSSIIERVKERCKPPDAAVLMFFCDHRDPSKSTLSSFLMSITRQLLEISPTCMEKAKDACEEKKGHLGRPFNKAEYGPLIDSCLATFKRVFIVVDALDEASAGSDIVNALRGFDSTAELKSVSVNLLLTSRFDIRLERRVSWPSIVRLTLAENMRQDIEHFIDVDTKNRVDQRLIKIRDNNLVLAIQTKVKCQPGTFLQARLQLDYLASAKSDKEIKAMLNTLPHGLEHTYEAILSSIATRYPSRVEETKILLRCLVAANTSLLPIQIAEIMAIQPGERALDFDAVTTDPYDALETVLPLVVADQGDPYQGIKLSHYSLKEYLSSSQIRQGRAQVFYVDVQDANAWLAVICLQYLTFNVFDEEDCEDEDSDEDTDEGEDGESKTLVDFTDEVKVTARPDMEGIEKFAKYTFRVYAASNWYEHMRGAGVIAGFKDRYEPYISWFVNGDEGPACFRRAYESCVASYSRYPERPSAPIRVAIDRGLHGLVNYILPMLDSIDHVFADGYTCLSAAATIDEVSLVQMFLDLGACIDLKSPERELTALHFAAEFGCEETFDLLIKHGADPHARSRSKTTPFYRAARGGSTYILRKLKDLGSDINSLTYDRWSPLIEAIECGHVHVIRLLLEWGADTNIVTEHGITPWSFPYEAIMEVLKEFTEPRPIAGSGGKKSEPQLLPASAIGQVTPTASAEDHVRSQPGSEQIKRKREDYEDGNDANFRVPPYS